MRRVVTLLVALALAIPTAAGSRPWYVSPTGTDPSGLTIGTPASLATANSGVVEGDVVHMAAGYYSTAIRPLRGGSAAAGRIYYIGTFGVGDTTIVSELYCEVPYLSISGLTAYGNTTAYGSLYYGVNITADHDSLDAIYMPNGMPNVSMTGDNFRIVGCTFESDTLDRIGIGEESAGVLSDGLIKNSTFTLRHTESDWHVSRGAFHCSGTQGLEVTNCTFNITIGANAGGGTWKLYASSNGKWTDVNFNLYTVNPFTTCDECNSSRLRNGSHDNRFLRCAWKMNGSVYPFQFLASATGDAGMDAMNRNNTFYQCEWRSTAPSQNPLVTWQAGMRRDSLVYSTIVSAYAPPIGVLATTENLVCDSCTIAHNTFIKVCPDTVLTSGTPFWSSGTAHVIGGENWLSAPAKVSDNIFYSVDVHADSLVGVAGAAWSTDSITIAGRWGGNYNLWCGELGPDSLIYVGGAPVDTATLRSTYGVETNSRFGDPRFIGGTPTVLGVPTFDAGLRNDSPAIGKGSGGSDIGAKQYTVLADSFTIIYRANAHGSIAPASDTLQRVAYDSCAAYVEAVADANYNFSAWSDGWPATQRGLTDCNISADATYTASFLPDSFTVSYAAGAGGTIIPVDRIYQRVAWGEDALFVVALANTGYHFVRWLPDSNSSAARTDTSIAADTSYTATFSPNTYIVSYVAGTGGTIVGNSHQAVLYGQHGTAVTARANTGYHFTTWSNGRTDSTRTDSTVTENHVFAASFARNSYTLTYTAGAGGSIVGTSPQTVMYGNDGDTVTATPSNGYLFDAWSDAYPTAIRRDTSVTANVTASASFTLNASVDPGMSLSAASAFLSSRTKSFTISSTGTTDLHVWSVTLNHLSTRGVRTAVACAKSSAAQTIAPGGSVVVTLSTIVLYPPTAPLYEVVVTSDAGTRRLYWTYNRCP